LRKEVAWLNSEDIKTFLCIVHRLFLVLPILH
jgi:hypothetical protein